MTTLEYDVIRMDNYLLKSIPYIWHFQTPIFPLMSALVVFFIVDAIRTARRYYYVPFYFPFMLDNLNKDLYHYLGEEYKNYPNPMLTTVSDIEPLTEEGASLARKRFISMGIVSGVVSSVLIPTSVSLIWAFLVQYSGFWVAFCIVLIYKLYRITLVVLGFNDHAIGSRKTLTLVSVIYMAYLFVMGNVLHYVYHYVKPYVLSGNYGGLFASINNFLFSSVINIGIISLLTGFTLSLIADKKLRKNNLHTLDRLKKTEERARRRDSTKLFVAPPGPKKT